jgi:hypothetical protein
MLSVANKPIVLSVIMLNAVMLNVVAPRVVILTPLNEEGILRETTMANYYYFI